MLLIDLTWSSALEVEIDMKEYLFLNPNVFLSIYIDEILPTVSK